MGPRLRLPAPPLGGGRTFPPHTVTPPLARGRVCLPRPAARRQWHSEIAGAFTAAWDFVKGIFHEAMGALEKLALEIVLKIVEPFSHLPGVMGGWARSTKDAIHVELNTIDAAARVAAEMGRIRAV